MESLHYGKILGEDRTNIGFYWEIATGIYYANLGGEGVAVDGDAEPSTASGGCSEAEHPQRSKKSSKRAARRFFRTPQGGGGRCACGYLGSVSVRSTDLDFSPQKNLNSYPALQATERGSSRGNLSPLTVFWFLLYAQKERHGGEPYRLCLCKRQRDAEDDHKLAPAG